MGYVISLLLLLFVLFALLLQAQMNISLAVLAFLAAAFAISRQWSRRATRGLRVQRRFVDRAFAGEEVTVQLRLENIGYLPVTWLQIEEEVPAGLAGEQRPVHVLGLGPKQRRNFSYTVYCRSGDITNWVHCRPWPAICSDSITACSICTIPAG